MDDKYRPSCSEYDPTDESCHRCEYKNITDKTDKTIGEEWLKGEPPSCYKPNSLDKPAFCAHCGADLEIAELMRKKREIEYKIKKELRLR